MALRIASAAVGLPVLAAAVWAGSPWFSILVAAAAGAAAFELTEMARRAGRELAALVAVVWSLSPVAAAHVWTADLSPELAFRVNVGIAVFAYLVWQVRRAQARLSWADTGVTAAIALYAGGLLAYALLLRALDQGLEWVFLVLLVTYATDTSAFIVGRRFGRRPMAPGISPGKTWEGAIAGLVGAVGACVALSSLMGLSMSTAQSFMLGALLGVAAQLGDLVESRMKRVAGVKDSGWLVPGHGGITDRMDSIVLNLIVLYYFVIWTVQ